MAFVNEIIKTDEQKAFFDSFGFRNYQGDILKVNKWFVDSLNHMYLFNMGGGAFEIPLMYGLYIESQGIIVIQLRTPQLDELGKISYQSSISHTSKEIKKIVVDALTDLGDAKVYGRFKNVDISTILEPEVMNNLDEVRYASHK